MFTPAYIPCAAYTPPPPVRSGWGDVAKWWHPAFDKASLLGESRPMAGWASGWKTACKTSHLTPDVKWDQRGETHWQGHYNWIKTVKKNASFSNKTRSQTGNLGCNPTWSLSWVSLQHFHCWNTSASLSRPAWWKWRILYWLSLLAITSWPLVQASSLQQHNGEW